MIAGREVMVELTTKLRGLHYSAVQAAATQRYLNALQGIIKECNCQK